MVLAELPLCVMDQHRDFNLLPPKYILEIAFYVCLTIILHLHISYCCLRLSKNAKIVDVSKLLIVMTT
jgi:hypothetical protein